VSRTDEQESRVHGIVHTALSMLQRQLKTRGPQPTNGNPKHCKDPYD